MVSQAAFTVASIRNQWEELRQVTRSKFVETMTGPPVPLPVFMSRIQDHIRAIDAQIDFVYSIPATSEEEFFEAVRLTLDEAKAYLASDRGHAIRSIQSRQPDGI
ncbi:hypothetical protein PENFLA_c103G10845 [Penicillium flavigenum]|uniref:Uncharacterized protein n=1 Tax=Penicillium flavigenum TaxID=254877 RepID=A0A1V6S6L5_9EURO|nr:hypothetical protein PENFLA_c103G10845 [Penicillium flavigenum]